MNETINEKKSTYIDTYNNFQSGWSGYFNEAKLDLEMQLGAHFDEKQYTQARKTGRTLIPFNKTARQVDLIHGYAIRNRHILKIGPVGREDDSACRQHTAIVMKQMGGYGYDVLEEAFKWGSLVTGSNLFELYLDREGTVQYGRRPYNSFLLDPSLTKPDLSDCGEILTGCYLSDENVKLLLPADSEKLDEKLSGKRPERWTETTKTLNSDKKRLYEERWRQKTDFIDYVISRLTGQEIPFDKFAKNPQIGGRENANNVIKLLNLPNGLPVFSKYKKPVRKVTLDIFVDGELFWEGDNPTGLDEYNFVWVSGEWVPECERDELKLRSLTRRLRMPQNARDKRLNQAIDIIESQIMSGTVSKEGAILNQNALYKGGQGKHIIVRKDFAGGLMDAVQKIQGSDIPAGVFNLIEILDREETETTGLNQEIFGSDDKDIPGILHRYRTGQALTAQQGLFQGFRRAKWQIGIKSVKMNQKNLTPDIVMRYINERPAQGFYLPDFTKYDCEPTEGLLTDSQRHLWYLELKELYQMFPQYIPASAVLEAAPVQYPEKLLDTIKKKEQMESMLMQAQLQTKQAMDSMLQAQATVDLARSRSEVVTQDYDRARTMTEMQKLRAEPQLDLIGKYLELLKIMQNTMGMNQQRPPLAQ
jgi:hypothetical protein